MSFDDSIMDEELSDAFATVDDDDNDEDDDGYISDEAGDYALDEEDMDGLGYEDPGSTGIGALSVAMLVAVGLPCYVLYKLVRILK